MKHQRAISYSARPLARGSWRGLRLPDPAALLNAAPAHRLEADWDLARHQDAGHYGQIIFEKLIVC